MDPVDAVNADAVRCLFRGGRPFLSLAPMQDITDLAFWRLIASHGGADVYFTEYFRVTPGNYSPDRAILRSVTENPTGKPAIAQLIGNDIEAMCRVARRLGDYPVAGIDLNLGCPAPVVYRKCAGGGLLRDPSRIDALLGALREAVRGVFTVKTRIGFADPGEFDTLMEVFSRHDLDLLTVHGRTVADKYRPHVHRRRIADAVRAMPFPVQANGGIECAESALGMLEETGAAGLMIGRAAIRNPWIFQQVRDRLDGLPVRSPTGTQVLAYIHDLHDAVRTPGASDAAQVQRMKKSMNFVGEGIEDSESFLHAIRRCRTLEEFFAICSAHLDHDRPVPLVPPDSRHPHALHAGLPA
jgi:tRNA-dihydrouridine synthase B